MRLSHVVVGDGTGRLRARRAARAECRLRGRPAREPVGVAVEPAVDAPRDAREIARVGELVAAARLPEPAGDQRRPSGLFEPIRLGLEVWNLGAAQELAQRVARLPGIRAAGELDQAAPQVAPAVAGLRVAQVGAALVALLRGGRPPD